MAVRNGVKFACLLVCYEAIARIKNESEFPSKVVEVSVEVDSLVMDILREFRVGERLQGGGEHEKG